MSRKDETIALSALKAMADVLSESQDPRLQNLAAMIASETGEPDVPLEPLEPAAFDALDSADESVTSTSIASADSPAIEQAFDAVDTAFQQLVDLLLAGSGRAIEAARRLRSQRLALEKLKRAYFRPELEQPTDPDPDPDSD